MAKSTVEKDGAVTEITPESIQEATASILDSDKNLLNEDTVPDILACDYQAEEADQAMQTAYVVINYGDNRSMTYGDDIALWRALRKAEKQAGKSFKDRKGVVIIQSHGGIADVAYKMANLIRRFFGPVEIVVPFRAKSAATLFSMCADTLIMGALSELGPLDVQTEHPGTESSVVSGLDVPQALNNILATAWLLSEKAALSMRRGPGISRKDALVIGSQFGASVVQGLLSQVDPVAVSTMERALTTASEYGQRLLSRYMLANAQGKINHVIKSLVNKYPTHSFVIDAEEASSLGLNITAADDYPEFPLCYDLYEVLKPQKDNELRIEIILQEDLGSDDSDNEDTGITEDEGENAVEIG